MYIYEIDVCAGECVSGLRMQFANICRCVAIACINCRWQWLQTFVNVNNNVYVYMYDRLHQENICWKCSINCPSARESWFSVYFLSSFISFSLFRFLFANKCCKAYLHNHVLDFRIDPIFSWMISSFSQCTHILHMADAALKKKSKLRAILFFSFFALNIYKQRRKVD